MRLTRHSKGKGKTRAQTRAGGAPGHLISLPLSDLSTNLLRRCAWRQNQLFHIKMCIRPTSIVGTSTPTYTLHTTQCLSPRAASHSALK